MTSQIVNDDPFATANEPPVLSGDLWGKVQLDAWYCVLKTGIGRTPFDPQVDNPKERRTAIDIYIDPLPELNITNENVCQRKMLAESKDWRNITLASLHDLGIQDVRSINGKYAHIVPEPNGKTYEKNGETRNETAFKFLALFDNEDTCRVAYLNAGGQSQAATQYDPSGAPVDTSEKDTARAFLKVIVEQAIRGKSPDQYRDAVASALAGFPMVNKFFTGDSPEVQELLPAG